MRKIAGFISYLFHPTFSPLILLFILFQLPIYINYKLTEEYMLFVYGVIFLNLIIAPILISLHLKKKGYIDSLFMPTAKQRVMPYFLISFFYILTYFLLDKINFPQVYLMMYKAACFVVICLLIFSTMGFKCSAHLSALGGVCGALIIVASTLKVDTTLILITFFLFSGMVASARYILKAHSFFELTIGFALGVGMQILIFL